MFFGASIFLYFDIFHLLKKRMAILKIIINDPTVAIF